MASDRPVLGEGLASEGAEAPENRAKHLKDESLGLGCRVQGLGFSR